MAMNRAELVTLAVEEPPNYVGLATLAEAAAFLGRSKSTVTRLIEAGKLRAGRAGRRPAIDWLSLHAYKAEVLAKPLSKIFDEQRAKAFTVTLNVAFSSERQAAQFLQRIERVFEETTGTARGTRGLDKFGRRVA